MRDSTTQPFDLHPPTFLLRQCPRCEPGDLIVIKESSRYDREYVVSCLNCGWRTDFDKHQTQHRKA